MISKEKKNTLHIASCSFGKDSLATILLALEHGEPLDEAVYCEVMFDKRTSGEVPEHRAFIYETALPRLERLGIPVRVLRVASSFHFQYSLCYVLSITGMTPTLFSFS